MASLKETPTTAEHDWLEALRERVAAKLAALTTIASRP